MKNWIGRNVLIFQVHIFWRILDFFHVLIVLKQSFLSRNRMLEKTIIYAQ